jgi:hypothetical protein
MAMETGSPHSTARAFTGFTYTVSIPNGNILTHITSETKAQWMKQQDKFPFILHLFSTGLLFNSQPKSD